VNQHVTNGVTVVSHEAFVNARPVAQNVMRVDAREVASAPVSRMAGAEPVRTSVLGAGRPAPVRPPAAVVSRTVVAVRTPPAPPRPIEQRQAQAGGRLNEQALVHPAAPARPAQMNQNQSERRPVEPGFRPFTPPNSGNNNQTRPMPQSQPRTYEQQGNTQPENRNPQANDNRQQTPENRIQPTNREFRQEQEQQRPAETHPLVRPTPPVQERSPQQERQQEQKFNQWHQQRPSPPPSQQRQPQSRPSPPPKQEKQKSR